MTIADYMRFRADVESIAGLSDEWTLERAIKLADVVLGVNTSIPEQDMLRAVLLVYAFSPSQWSARAARSGDLPIDHAAACVMSICCIPEFADAGRRHWMLSAFITETPDTVFSMMHGLYAASPVISIPDALFWIRMKART